MLNLALGLRSREKRTSMKLIFSLIFLSSFAAQANPIMSTKERLRLHLWVYGIEEKPVQKVKADSQPLPEEIERALKKI